MYVGSSPKLIQNYNLIVYFSNTIKSSLINNSFNIVIIINHVKIAANHKLPAGCQILIVPAAVHMNPKIFPNPKEFNPENFTRERIAERHKYSYLPFSGGPRACIGK